MHFLSQLNAFDLPDFLFLILGIRIKRRGKVKRSLACYTL